jgi:hypothetical protein
MIIADEQRRFRLLFVPEKSTRTTTNKDHCG